MPCGLIRYPGGTIADNFHWKTAILDNTNRFPYASGSANADFDEFMTFCKSVGAEPMLVVNTESWARKGDVSGGAQEAADWVRYCQQKGYQVKYWEIGNETYWHTVMTAKEYGVLVKEYAQAMRAVNPDIIIGANGHWDIELVGTKERTDSSKMGVIRNMEEKTAGQGDVKTLKAYIKKNELKDKRAGGVSWWKTVAETCGDDIDMLIVHWYYFPAKSGSTKNMTASLRKVEALFKSVHPQKKYVMCLSEYNCNSADTTERVLGFAESLGRFLEGGITLATFWPMRMSGGLEKRALLTQRKKIPQYPYEILSLFAKNLTGHLVRVSADDHAYTFASYDGAHASVFISGRRIKSRSPVTISFDGASFSHAEGIVATATKNTPPIRLQQKPVAAGRKGDSFTCEVEPGTFIFLQFKNP